MLGRTFPSPSLSAISAGRVRVPLESMYKPGISSGICGTAYADSVLSSAISSAVSSVRGQQSGDTTPVGTPSKEKVDAVLSSNASSLKER